MTVHIPRDDTEALTTAMRIVDAQALIIEDLRAGAARNRREPVELVRRDLPKLNEYFARRDGVKP